MIAPLRVEALNADGSGSLSSTNGLTFVKVFCWAQLAMVIANLGRIPVLSTEDRDFPIAFNELSLGAMLIAAALTLRSWRSIRFDRVSLTALLFAAIGAGSALWSMHRFDMTTVDLFVALAYLARWLTYFTLYVAIINVVRERSVEVVWGAVELMLVAFGLFGIVQSAFLPNFAQMVYQDSRAFNWDEQGHRLISTVLEPNIAGTMLMVAVLIHIARITVGAPVRWVRVAVIFTAFTLTISRSAAIGLIIGMVVILAAHGLSRRLARTLVAAGVLIALVSPLLIRYLAFYGKFSVGEGSSAGARVATWLQAIQIVSDYPVFGVGFNAYRHALEHYGVDIIGASSYGTDGGLLFIMALTGVVGLTVYCIMIGQVFARCRSIWRDQTVPVEQRGIAIGTGAATLGMVFASTFVNALLTTFVMEILWVTWGLTFVIARAQRERASSPPVHDPRIVALAA